MNALVWCTAAAPPLLTPAGQAPLHLPWPSLVRIPRGWEVRAAERGGAMTVIVSAGGATAVARLDLYSREVVVSAKDSRVEMRQLTRQQALRFAAERSRREDQQGEPREALPAYSAADVSSWTDMQVFAGVASGYWYPPIPEDENTADWDAYRQETGTLNRFIRRRRFAPARARR